ncbi:MAG: hypothetical protein HOP18_23635 [Deltaproteobacteria bacterium]|nr:hypothetical protein [Deltaproteobacteria bacterium]
MTEPITLAQVEALTAGLPLAERLQLVAHVREQRSVSGCLKTRSGGIL